MHKMTRHSLIIIILLRRTTLPLMLKPRMRGQTPFAFSLLGIFVKLPPFHLFLVLT
jgi:hypothetical protein